MEFQKGNLFMRKKILAVLNILLLGLLVSYIAGNRAFAIDKTMPIHQIAPNSVRPGMQNGYPVLFATLEKTGSQSLKEACDNARNTISGTGSGYQNVIYAPQSGECYTYPTGKGYRSLQYIIYERNVATGGYSLQEMASDNIANEESKGLLSSLTAQMQNGSFDVILTNDMQLNPQKYEMCLSWRMSKVGASHLSSARSITSSCQPLDTVFVKNECEFHNVTFKFPDAIANSQIRSITENMYYSCKNANTPIKLSWNDFSYDCNQTGIKINSGTANTCVEVTANNNIIRQANTPISMTLQNKTGYIPFSAAIQNQRIASPGTYTGSRQLLISYD